MRLAKRSAQRVPFYFCDVSGVKSKQKSLSRKQQDCFDEAHAPVFKSTSGPVKCSHRLDEKPCLNKTRK